jgi:hypothetical protein
MVLDQDGRRLVIDPGAYTTDLPTDLGDVAAVFVSHQHPDHYDPARLSRLAAANPGLRLIAGDAVLGQLPGSLRTELDPLAVASGDTATVGPFSLAIYGAAHAQVIPGAPAVPCLGVMANAAFAYGGDAFPAPPRHPAVLAVPVAGAWVKGQDIISYVLGARAGAAFPVHEALASDRGLALVNAAVGPAAAAAGLAWQVLSPGQSIEA